MKKAIFRVLLIICGLNVFTACYGMPPGDWVEPVYSPEGQEQTKAPVQPAEDPDLEESDRIEIVNPVSTSEMDDTKIGDVSVLNS